MHPTHNATTHGAIVSGVVPQLASPPLSPPMHVQLLLEGPMAAYARLSSRSPRPGAAFSESMVGLAQNLVVNCSQIKNGLKKLEASGILAEVLERHPRGGS